MIKADQLKSLGQFQRTHGLKGELNALFEIDPEFLEDGYPIILDIDGIFVPFYADSVRPKGATTDLIKLNGVDSEEEARTFVNKTIYGLRDDIADFTGEDPDSVFDPYSLRDFSVIDASLGMIGRVVEVDDSTANILLVVADAQTGGNRIQIPMVEAFVKAIDYDNGRIEVDVPEELINLNSTPADDPGQDFGDTSA